jgi:hypothetical protein
MVLCLLHLLLLLNEPIVLDPVNVQQLKLSLDDANIFWAKTKLAFLIEEADLLI